MSSAVRISPFRSISYRFGQERPVFIRIFFEPTVLAPVLFRVVGALSVPSRLCTALARTPTGVPREPETVFCGEAYLWPNDNRHKKGPFA
jgi:hypothetical protein